MHGFEIGQRIIWRPTQDLNIEGNVNRIIGKQLEVKFESGAVILFFPQEIEKKTDKK